MNKDQNLVWIDLEFSTLNFEKAQMMEIACVITDSNLNTLNEGIDIIIHCGQEIFDTLEPKALEMHRRNGLLDRCLTSGISLTESQDLVEAEILKYCQPKTSPLCGNTNWIDRVMIIKHYPKIHQLLHYRHIDVSTVKNLANRWYSNMPDFTSSKDHTAIGDIKKSIEEIKYYKEHIFK